MDPSFAAALLGALVGGIVTLGVSIVMSQRERRARYGEQVLEALLAARIALQDARTDLYAGGDVSGQRGDPVDFGTSPRRLWVSAALASSVELLPSRRRSIQGWSLHLHESMLGGVYGVESIEHLERQLAASEHLIVAWISRRASGRDFRRSFTDIARRFGPKYTERDIPAG